MLTPCKFCTVEIICKFEPRSEALVGGTEAVGAVEVPVVHFNTSVLFKEAKTATFNGWSREPLAAGGLT